MRVRDWQDILTEVTEGSGDPDRWRAVAGRRRSGIGEDLYIAHPNTGVYLLKTYSKHPREIKGVGTQIARRVDEDLAPLLPREEDDGRFAVRSPPEDEREAESIARRLRETLKVHSEAPTGPDDLFEDVMEALDSPAYGPMEFDPRGRPERLTELSSTFEEAESILDAELDDLIEDDGVDRGFE